ncbi:MAG: pyridoxine 5'-phosphate synthase [Verrucomicrobia bacterium]|nr:pyridoxine 5'-phosphate synthase [Verrucomicrobiota bacterium]
MPLLLGVNIDHVATLRQARYAQTPASPHAEPCPVAAGHDAQAGGADALTLHVRGDRRHMQEADALRIRAEIPLPLNLEMGVTGEMVGMALKLKPDFVCLVPEARMEITTEGGLDVLAGLANIRTVVACLQNAGIKVSLFVDPDLKQIAAAVACHAQMIEYLLANRDLSLEIEGPALALAFDTRLSAAETEANLQRLLEIRLRLPEYLFTKT